jgi:hypothetical protein
MHGRDEKCVQYFGWKPRCSWQDNVRIDLRKIGWEVVDWIHLVKDRNQWQVHANMVINVRLP